MEEKNNRVKDPDSDSDASELSNRSSSRSIRSGYASAASIASVEARIGAMSEDMSYLKAGLAKLLAKESPPPPATVKTNHKSTREGNKPQKGITPKDEIKVPVLLPRNQKAVEARARQVEVMVLTRSAQSADPQEEFHDKPPPSGQL